MSDIHELKSNKSNHDQVETGGIENKISSVSCNYYSVVKFETFKCKARAKPLRENLKTAVLGLKFIKIDFENQLQPISK